jgi:hypothetical protein
MSNDLFETICVVMLRIGSFRLFGMCASLNYIENHIATPGYHIIFLDYKKLQWWEDIFL